MQHNIDLILETSLFDKGSVILRKSELDLHDLLAGIIDTVAYEVEEKKGSLTKGFNAENYMISADEVHLSNAIFNLIDNALKYSGKLKYLQEILQATVLSQLKTTVWAYRPLLLIRYLISFTECHKVTNMM